MVERTTTKTFAMKTSFSWTHQVRKSPAAGLLMNQIIGTIKNELYLRDVYRLMHTI